MATTTVASLLALVERPDIWAHIACHLGGDELWRARRVNRGLRSACEAELRELNLSSYTAVTDEGLRVFHTLAAYLHTVPILGEFCAIHDLRHHS